jgi:drug/metabolite transporter (DMT)-like permease
MEKLLVPQVARSVTAGVLWVLAGTFTFSLVTASGKLFGIRAEIPVIQIVFMRYCGGFATSFLIVMYRRQLKAALQSGQVRKHFLRSILGAGGVVFSLYAATHMPLVEAGAIGLTQGMFVMIFAALLLREPTQPLQWLAAIICFGGALIVISGRNPFGAYSAEHFIPAGMALLGAICIAAELILVKVLSGRDSPTTVVLYVNMISAGLLLLPAATLWKTLNYSECALLLCIGPLAVSAQHFNILAYQQAPASLLGPIGYSRVVFAGCVGFAVFGEIPTVSAYIGSAVVVLGGLMLTGQHLRSQRRAIQGEGD